MSRVALLQAALGGPVVAALAWLGLARWPWVRRPVAGLLALAAHAGAWGVLWLTYRGDELAWRSFQPELLGATVVVVTELALLLVAVRAERHPGGGNAAALTAIGVSASALAALAYAQSVAVVALALPLPTIATAVAALSGKGREDARGLIGLAAADAVALVGLSLVYARTGSVAVGEAGGMGPVLLLAAAAAKSGAIPWLATWRVASTNGPAAWLDVALRGQAVALAALATLTMRGSAPVSALAVVAVAAILVAGIIAHAGRSESELLAAASGAAAGVPLLALGLGGAVGTRAFLLLFPALLLSVALVALLARPDPAGEAEGATPKGPVPVWGWIAACALGVGLGSLLGLPPGGGFPGTWLTISLAGARSELTLGWMLAAGGCAVGLGLAMLAAVRLVRTARARALPASVGAVVALLLLYLGTQPIRIGLGWWVRVETALDLPELLPSAGAPGLPAIGGMRLLLLLAPALLLVVLVVGLGRGVRDTAPGPAPERPAPAMPRRLRRALDPVVAAARPVTDLLSRARAVGVGFALVGILELATLLIAGRIVLLSARAGFL